MAAAADPDVLAKTPREQAMRLYSQATKMFEDQDFVAAAVTFGQAAQLLGRVDRDQSGAVVDKEAHSFRSAALSNRATAYSRAGLYVEAADAFVSLREQFGAELAEKDRSEIDDAIAHTEERIGTIALRRLPAGDLEVRFDGRLERRPLDKPLRMAEGVHSIDIVAKDYRPYAAEITVTGKQEVVHEPKLVPLDTPAKLRVEATVSSSVSIDGIARGDAPVEVSLPPGHHQVAVTSESYLDQHSDVELRPGERSILHVGMVPARAPLGLRVQAGYLGSFPQRKDTPFGTYNNNLVLALFQSALRIRSVRFGLEVAYTPGTINTVATGIIGTWCPDRLTWGDVAVCPVTLVPSYVFGTSAGNFESGFGRFRGTSVVELRRGGGFARAGLGLSIDQYIRQPNASYLVLWSTTAELELGVDL